MAEVSKPGSKPAKWCIGFGEYEGMCSNMSGPNPHWCPRCDRIRIDYLDRQFRKISKQFRVSVDMDGTGA